MAPKKGKILVVDDNAGIRQALKILLPLYFEAVETLPSPSTLVAALERFQPDVVLLDMNFHTEINTGNEGLYWTTELKKMAPDVEVVLFTAYADIQLAVEGMKRGAFDFSPGTMKNWSPPCLPPGTRPGKRWAKDPPPRLLRTTMPTWDKAPCTGEPDMP